MDGYTPAMKTAVSIPDEVYQGTERLARRTKRSRSRIFSDALREYLARHCGDEVTAAVNQAYSEIDDLEDALAVSAGRFILERSEW